MSKARAAFTPLHKKDETAAFNSSNVLDTMMTASRQLDSRFEDLFQATSVLLTSLTSEARPACTDHECATLDAHHTPRMTSVMAQIYWLRCDCFARRKYCRDACNYEAIKRACCKALPVLSFVGGHAVSGRKHLRVKLVVIRERNIVALQVRRDGRRQAWRRENM